MREYTKKPKNQSRTLDSNRKASKQAPIAVILQRYKEQCPESIRNQYINSKEAYITQLKVIQKVLIDGIEVNKSTGMPSWTQDGIDYHINLSTDTRHITKSEARRPKIHYFFQGSGTDITDKQPTKEERGKKVKVKGHSKIKTSTVFSKLPFSVQTFIKSNWMKILGD